VRPLGIRAILALSSAAAGLIAALVLPEDVAAGAQRAGGPAPFIDITAESGLDFIHDNGSTGELLLPEVIGAGGALFDYDNDGDLDLFAVQGSMLRRGGSTGAARPGGAIAADARRLLDERDVAAPRSRLFRNELSAAGRRPRFTDVSDGSGAAISAYGMGAATGDFDNDGWVDVYVTALGPNHLLRNNGDGTFSDVTTQSGTADDRWSTGATFFDYDRDGWLDLFVTNYVQFSTEMKRSCFSASSARDYCNPSVYPPAADRLFRNNRDGTFADVTARARVGPVLGRGLGVLAVDANEDGWLDLYVANDGDANQLWINDRGGAFRDDALLAGVALNRMGQAQGSMGLDAADYDRDGDQDLFVTNLDNEGNTLYRNLGGGVFDDRTVEAGLFKLGSTGFGTRFVDYDNDGWLDLVVVNGAVRQLGSQVRAGDRYPLRQRNQLFRSERGRRFVEVSAAAGAAFAPLHVGRGLATGDVDNDGDVDLVMFNNSGPARILLNETGRGRHWLGLRLVDTARRRDALHASVVLAATDGAEVVRRVQTDGSYASAGDPRIVFGLGDEARPQTVRVRWPAGTLEEFRALRVDRYWTLEPGKAPR
jgi:enediyne biosynthesis protein E4